MKKNRIKKFFVPFLCVLFLVCCAGLNENEPEQTVEQTESVQQSVSAESEAAAEERSSASEEETEAPGEKAEEQTVSLSEIPEYTGSPYTIINNNVPFFSDSEMPDSSCETYSELDSLGRCGVCAANVGQDIMPTEEYGGIGNVKPAGWHTVKYAGIVEGNYLYNRCHLIGFQLTGETDNNQNLITGTRYMNVEGMLPFENMVADYVKETGCHVMYRVTPLYNGDNLLADGVLMEAKSVEDDGRGILFNVFCYNVQPGIEIDYATGDSKEDPTFSGGMVVKEQTAPSETGQIRQEQPETPKAPEKAETPETQEKAETPTTPEQPETPEQTETPAKSEQPEQTEAPEKPKESAAPQSPESTGAYAVNANNGKIHIVGACPATGNAGNAMKHPVYFDTYEEAEAYSEQIAPSQKKRNCGNCW